MDWFKRKAKGHGIQRGEICVKHSALEKLQSNTWREVSSVGSMLLQAETGRRVFLAERTG